MTARDEAARAEAEWRREQLAGVEGSTEWGAGYDLGYVSGFQSGVAWADANPAEDARVTPTVEQIQEAVLATRFGNGALLDITSYESELVANSVHALLVSGAHDD